MEDLKNDIIDIFKDIVVKIYPLIGKGRDKEKEIDEIATREFGKIIEILHSRNKEIQVLSVEGERDGIRNTKLQFCNNKQKTGYIVCLDPIEGTLTGSLNGSRCISVISIAKNCNKGIYKLLPDSLSCFSSASNVDEKFLYNLSCDENKKIGKKDYKDIFINGNISTLRRKETEQLWCNILEMEEKEFEKKYKMELGENTFFMQNSLYKNVFWCGDSSMFLPFESDHFFGRTGIAEARIESRLWKYWKGLIVSSNKMKEYPTGRINYLIDRLDFINNKTKYRIEDFFTDEELECMYNNDWKNDEIIDYLVKDNFSPKFDLIMIFSITGTKDKKFSHHSKNNMKPLIYNKNNNEYKVELWTIENNQLNKKILKLKE